MLSLRLPWASESPNWKDNFCSYWADWTNSKFNHLKVNHSKFFFLFLWPLLMFLLCPLCWLFFLGILKILVRWGFRPLSLSPHLGNAQSRPPPSATSYKGAPPSSFLGNSNSRHAKPNSSSRATLFLSPTFLLWQMTPHPPVTQKQKGRSHPELPISTPRNCLWTCPLLCHASGSFTEVSFWQLQLLHKMCPLTGLLLTIFQSELPYIQV